MTFHLAAGNFPVLGIIYALAVLLVIAAIFFAIVKLSGRRARPREGARRRRM